MRVFIDSNIPMYVAGGPHPNRELAERFLRRIEDREIAGCTSTEVLQEILYRYSSLRRLDLAQEVYDGLVQICPEVIPVTLAEMDLARDLTCEPTGKTPRSPAGRPLSARDAIHAAVMKSHGIEWIATFDRGFDGVAGIRRLRLK